MKFIIFLRELRLPVHHQILVLLDKTLESSLLAESQVVSSVFTVKLFLLSYTNNNSITRGEHNTAEAWKKNINNK